MNPVAVMINKAMIEIPPKFAGKPPVNPSSKRIDGTWTGAQGLAEDVRYYGEWMKQEAFKRIGHLYPKVKDEHGEEHTVIDIHQLLNEKNPCYTAAGALCYYAHGYPF